MMLRNPQFLVLLLLLPAFAALWRWRRGRVSTGALGLRLAMVALVVVALAEPVFARAAVPQGALVLLVDQSDSLGADGAAALRARAAALVGSGVGQYAATRTLFFGKNQVVPVGENGASESLQTDATDLAGALRAARGLVGVGGGRVVLLSDGGQTRGDALAEADALAATGIPVDTIAATPNNAAESWVAAVEMPPTLRSGEEFRVEVVVASTDTGIGELVLSDGTRDLGSLAVELAPGEQRFAFTTRANEVGVLRLQARLQATPDGEPRNNQAAATALVAPPPRVLLVEGRGGGAAPLRVGLRAAGVESEVVAAQALPSDLSPLDQFEGVVLIDVPAGDMTLDQMAALREYVRSEGRGLVVTGGRSSFTLGAYKGTPLEEALPVLMDPPPRPQRSDVTMLLIVDRSASMGGTTPSKFDMAKEAALLATESLRDEDRLGVLSFDTAPDRDDEWTVPFQQIGTGLGLAEIQNRIASIKMGGGTDILAALQSGLPQLAAQEGTVRHAVLLTDGRSFTNEYPRYRQLVEQAREQNITLSAIAIGADSDTQLLQNLADWGAGRYHFAAQPADIPSLTMLESEIARTEPQIEGDFRASQTAPHPLLRLFPATTIPQLAGYVGTTLKPQAEMVLASPDDDPVLAVWQYGLGRAVAWTPSVEEPWAPNWANWPEYGQFWAQIIRYVLPDPDSGLTQARVVPRGDEVVISVDALSPGGVTLDLADTQATITLPDGGTRIITLRQTGPGRYAESVRLSADGAYIVDIVQQKDRERRRASVGYVQPYPAELLPVREGAALLVQISARTGGAALSPDLDSAGSPAEPTPATPVDFGLAPWLLLAAALLWPAEIAVRRGWLRR